MAVCAANGITLGKTETSFDPIGNITRYQVISMVVRTADNLQPGLLTPPPSGFGTWSGDPTHGSNAARAEYNSLLSGLSLSSLNPYGNMTRGEVAQVLHNLLVKLGTGPGPTTYTLAVSVAGTGSGTVTASPNLTSYTAGSTVALTATADTGSLFMGWSGDAAGDTNPLTVTMDSNKTIVATFNTATVLYSLSTSVPGGGGTVTKSPNQPLYPSGSSVVLTAVPGSGYTFHHWAGDAAGTTNPVTVVVDSNKSVQAVFVSAVTYTLSIAINPGQGTVTRNPAKSSYSSGETVVLTATPAAGYTFSGWSMDASGTANPLTVTMDSNKTIKANFTEILVANWALVVSVPGGHGTVTRNPDQIWYPGGSSVVLTAVPATGYRFSYWSGDHIGVTNPATVVMDSGKTIYAHFEQLPTYTLTTQVANGYGMVLRSPNKTTFYEGESVTLTAIPSTGYHFARWWGSVGSTSNPITFTMNANKLVKVDFEHD